MRLTATSSILLFARLARATSYDGGATGDYLEGAYGTGLGDQIPDESPFIYGNAHPNATNSVPVNGFVWRTNVSEVSANDANTSYQPNSSKILDARIINTVFDLTWPGNYSIGQALLNNNNVAPYGCILFIDGLALPENVTSKYTAADNGSCTNVLGSDCVRGYLASIVVDTPGCPSRYPNPPVSCAGTLGAAKAPLNMSTFSMSECFYPVQEYTSSTD